MSRREHYWIQERRDTVVAPQESTFPIYADGDVKIVITGARQYQLHSSLLKRHSPVFMRLLDDAHAAQLSSKALRKGAVVRHRLIGISNPEMSSGSDVEVLLQPVPLDSNGKTQNSSFVDLRLENGIVVLPVYEAYQAVLGTFYGLDIDLETVEERGGLQAVLVQAVSILKVAEYLQVVHMVSARIEATLLATGQILQRSIATTPTAWLDFAFRIKSRPIFREALIHTTGQYNTPSVQEDLRTTMKKPLLEIVEKKAQLLLSAVKTAQLNILSYYPSQICRERTHDRAGLDNITRSSYGNDIMSWIALVAFRHYAAQGAVVDQTHRAEDMGYEYMHKIRQGGEQYLSKKEMAGFHGFFPMSGKGEVVVENRLMEVKEGVKRFTLVSLSLLVFPIRWRRRCLIC